MKYSCVQWLRIRLMLVFLFAVAALPVHAAAGSTPKRMLLFPFTVYAPADMAYLSQAAQQMLISRLTRPGELEIIQETAAVTDPADIAERLQETGADYALGGSLTLFGKEVSTDAMLYTVGRAAPIKIFHEYGRTDQGVLIHMEKLVEQIQPELAEKPAAALPKPKAAGDAAVLWRSPGFGFGIVGISAGDVTGDGRNELVIADKDRIRLYTFQNDALTLLAEASPKSGTRILGVDVADMNDNRRAEIYLTRVRRDGGLSSAVFEWNGNGLTVVAEGLEWFFQAQYMPHEEKAAIVGQKAGALSGSAANLGERGLFAPGIYRLQWQSGTLVSQGRLNLPEGTQIFGFASGDLMGNGSRQVLRYTRRDLLQLFNSDNVEEWCSADAYGGSTIYLEVAAGIDPEDNARYYLPQRLRLAASERDQKYRAIVSRNEEAGGRIFRRFRKFTGGWMEILAWNGVGLQTEWQSQRLAGYVSDFVLADMDHDGRRDLVYAQVSDSGSFSRSSNSRIYIQALEGIF